MGVVLCSVEAMREGEAERNKKGIVKAAWVSGGEETDS